MDQFLKTNEWIILIFLIAIIVVCVFMLFWVIPRRRKLQSQKQTQTVTATPEASNISNQNRLHQVELNFVAFLQAKSGHLGDQMREVRLILESYQDGKGDEFNFRRLTGRFGSKGLFQIDTLLKDFHPLTDHPHAPRIARALVEANTDIIIAESRIDTLAVDFHANYQRLVQAFGQNIVRLSQLYDHLRSYSRGKRLKPDVDAFVKDYLRIFSEWSSAGADKSVEAIRNDLVVPLLAVNENYPQNPFAKQIEEYGLKCEGAYEEICQQDKRARSEMRNLRNTLKRTRRIVRRILARAATGSTSAPVRPHSEVPPKTSSQVSAEPPASDIQPPLPKTPEPASTTPPPVSPQSVPARDKGMSVLAKDTLKKLNIDPDELSEAPQHTSAPPAQRTTATTSSANRSPQRLAAIIVGVLLGGAVLAAGGYYGWQYLQKDKINFSGHAGISHVPEEGREYFESFEHHYTVIKSKLDSLHPSPVAPGLIDSLGRQIDSLQSANPAAADSLQSHRDSLRNIHEQSRPPEPEYGIDVSRYQGNINWPLIATDSSGPKPLHFAIIQSSHGTKLDTKFERNWQHANDTRLAVGAYHFLYFHTDAKAQANFYIENVPLAPGHIRPIVDVERNCRSCEPTGGLSDTELVQHIRDFLEVVEDHYQTQAIIYTGDYYYEKHLEGHFPDNDFWLAQYDKNQNVQKVIHSHANPKDNETAVMWQFTPYARVPGIDSVDMSYLPGQYVERVLIK